MALSAQKAANNARYMAKLDNLMVRPSKDEGAVIRTAAANAGQSVQAYIIQAIRERMERDGLTVSTDAGTVKGGE